MSPRVVSPIEQLEIVSLLAHGSRNFMSVSRKTGVPELLVMEIGQTHGWPDLGKLSAAAEAMRTARPEIPHAQPAVVAPAAQQPPARTEVAPARPAPVAATSASVLLDLRQRAQGWPKLVARIEGVATTLEQITKAIEKNEAEERVKRAERERKAKLRQEIAAAAAQLAKMRAELGAPTKRSSAEARAESAAIRKWAGENGVRCTERGSIPTTVREAWEKAQG